MGRFNCKTLGPLPKKRVWDQYNLTIVFLPYLYNLNFDRYIQKYGIDNFKKLLIQLPIEGNLDQYILNLIDNKNVNGEYIDYYFEEINNRKVFKL